MRWRSIFWSGAGWRAIVAFATESFLVENDARLGSKWRNIFAIMLASLCVTYSIKEKRLWFGVACVCTPRYRMMDNELRHAAGLAWRFLPSAFCSSVPTSTSTSASHNFIS